MKMSMVWVVVLAVAGSAAAEDPVYFSDENLKAAVEAALWISDPTPTDMLELTSFTASSRGITSLTGLEYATNLYRLQLTYNRISNISPVSSLENLETLILNNNQISDISPVSSLEKLDHLDIHDNQISNISAVSGLDRLELLQLRSNQISNISAISDLTKLWSLDLGNNQISSISALSGLTDLETLDLHNNQISSVSALSGLDKLEDVDLHGNWISDVSALLGLANLESLNLAWNDGLNTQAYCTHLHSIVGNNPGLSLRYDPSSDPPSSVSASGGDYPDKVHVTWDDVCNGPEYTSYYRVYRAVSEDGPKAAISQWQTSLSYDDGTAESGTKYTYWVQTGTSSEGSDAGLYSAPAVGWLSYDPALTLSSTAGGSVTSPGEGIHVVGIGQRVDVVAEPLDRQLYAFAGWTGSAVTAGKVHDPSEARTTVTVDDDYTLKAHFVTVMGTIYVDDDALEDPGPGDAAVSDPNENGTSQHPFDRIQEAIEVAPDGISVVVRGGSYRENIELLGKSIELTGMDDNASGVVAYPLIEGADVGPILSFIDGEDPNCLLIGFIIARGKGALASAVYCQGSSPTVANCLIVGNRSSDPAGAAVYCIDSAAVFTHCTIADNHARQAGGGVVLVDSPVVLMNSILWGNTPTEVVSRGVAEPSIVYTDIAGWWADLGNIDADPMFAKVGYWADPNDPSMSVAPNDPGAVWIDGDYHLKSQAGRWDPQTMAWVRDEVTSPCLDAGDRTSPVGQEPVPNGNVVNLGAYGGTAQASKSQSGPE